MENSPEAQRTATQKEPGTPVNLLLWTVTESGFLIQFRAGNLCGHSFWETAHLRLQRRHQTILWPLPSSSRSSRWGGCQGGAVDPGEAKAKLCRQGGKEMGTCSHHGASTTPTTSPSSRAGTPQPGSLPATSCRSRQLRCIGLVHLGSRRSSACPGTASRQVQSLTDQN